MLEVELNEIWAWCSYGDGRLDYLGDADTARRQYTVWVTKDESSYCEDLQINDYEEIKRTARVIKAHLLEALCSSYSYIREWAKLLMEKQQHGHGSDSCNRR